MTMCYGIRKCLGLETKCSGRVSRRYLTGFTLIELLVVIAIIAVLLSILMPGLIAVKKQARDVLCFNNLHQLSLAWSMYLDDNDSRFPNRNDWPIELRRHYRTGDLRLCPEAAKPAKEGARQPFAAQGPLSDEMVWPEPVTSKDNYVSYGFNEWLCDIDEDFWRTCNVKGSSRIPLLMDSSWFSANPFFSDEPPAYPADVISGSGATGTIKHFCMNRHNPPLRGVTNGLFLDFSTRKVGLKELWKLKWHPNWPMDEPPPAWPEWMASFEDYEYEEEDPV